MCLLHICLFLFKAVLLHDCTVFFGCSYNAKKVFCWHASLDVFLSFKVFMVYFALTAVLWNFVFKLSLAAGGLPRTTLRNLYPQVSTNPET